MQRDAYQPTVSYVASTGIITINFNNTKTIDATVLRTPVTLNINLNGITGTYTATQNGTTIPSVKTGNTVSVNVYPHKGAVKLTCSDCSGTSTIPNVTKLTAAPQTNGAIVSWANPTSTFNNVLVVAKEGSGFTTKPTATSYIANANYTSIASAFEGGKVVYQGSGSSVNVTGLTTNKTYFFRVYVRNGTNWSNGVETSATTSGSTGSGLRCLQASYFNNVNLTGTPLAVRYETSINYNWGTSAPNIKGISANNFSIRWNGSFTATQTGNYFFTARADDGVRLWVNNSLIVNQWKDQSATSYTASIRLVQGKTYTIKMEYYERGGNAAAQLSWIVPTKTNQIMPFAANCTALASAQSTEIVSLDGRLTNNKAALQWVINTPKAIDYYQIEKRNAQGEFIPLSIVNDNNQSTMRLYNFVDEKLSEGDNDYRIQTIFADNNIPPQYSEVLKINYLKFNDYNVFPNPAQDNVQIDLSEAVGKRVDMRIFSIIGKELYREQIQSATNTPHVINLSSFEMGQYMIQINVAGQRPVTRKLIIGY